MLSIKPLSTLFDILFKICLYIRNLLIHNKQLKKILTKSIKEVLPYIQNFIQINGKPAIIQTDNGGELVNSLSEAYYKQLNIKHITSSPYHPESNGCVEVSHKETRKAIIAEYLKDKSKNFNLVYTCKNISDNHNNTIHSTTNYKPCELINCKDDNIIKIV